MERRNCHSKWYTEIVCDEEWMKKCREFRVERTCYEEEVLPYRKMEYKQIIIKLPNIALQDEHSVFFLCNHILFVEMVDTNSGTLGNFQIPVW